jgi:hypothetical protein
MKSNQSDGAESEFVVICLWSKLFPRSPHLTPNLFTENHRFLKLVLRNKNLHNYKYGIIENNFPTK